MIKGIDRIYVVHAPEGYEHREAWVKNLFKKYDLDFEFVGDDQPFMKSDSFLRKYFTPQYLKTESRNLISITLSHILCYEKMLKDGADVALVFEDDPYFLKGFNSILTKIVDEFQTHCKGTIVSIENSTLRFPRRSLRKKGQYLYKAESGRCAGAYLINQQGAKNILDSLKKAKCQEIIDWWHNQLTQQDVIKMFWAHPSIVEQGSLNGKIYGAHSSRKNTILRRISFSLEKFYKMYILYMIRR